MRARLECLRRTVRAQHLKYRWDASAWLLYAALVVLQLICGTAAYIMGAHSAGHSLSYLWFWLAFLGGSTAAVASWLLWLHGPWRPGYRDAVKKQEQETRHDD